MLKSKGSSLIELLVLLLITISLLSGVMTLAGFYPRLQHKYVDTMNEVLSIED